MRPRATFLIAGREVREALRSRWFQLAAGCFLLISIGLSAVGPESGGLGPRAGFDRATAGVLNLALFFVPLLTLTLGGFSIAGELEDGSIASLLAHPLTRGELYAGKYLGLLAAVSAAILAGFGAGGLLIGLRTGGDPGPFIALVGAVLMLAAATLALGLLLGVGCGSRLRVIGAVFALWLFLTVLCDLGAIGLTLARRLSPYEVFLLGSINPVQQARILGTLALSRRLDVLGPAGIFALDTLDVGGTVALLVVALAFWTVVPLVVGYLRFREQPLL